MPTYSFRCSQCEQVFDVKRSFSESADEAACPADGANGVRVFSPPTLLLSGGGAGPAPMPPTAPTGGGHGHDHGHGHSHGPGTHTH